MLLKVPVKVFFTLKDSTWTVSETRCKQLTEIQTVTQNFSRAFSAVFKMFQAFTHLRLERQSFLKNGPQSQLTILHLALSKSWPVKQITFGSIQSVCWTCEPSSHYSSSCEALMSWSTGWEAKQGPMLSPSATTYHLTSCSWLLEQCAQVTEETALYACLYVKVFYVWDWNLDAECLLTFLHV